MEDYLYGKETMIDKQIQQAFLDDILANPDDRDCRLIYADYLMEHGDEIDQSRGLLIQMQSTILESKQVFAHYRKVADMITQWQTHWLAREGIYFEWSNSVLDWRYGFLCCIECSIARWILSGPVIVKRHPVECVNLRWHNKESMTLREYFEQLTTPAIAKCPHLWKLWNSNTQLELLDSELLINWAKEVGPQ